MKPLIYVSLAILVVPVQTSLLQDASVLGVRPDLGLVVACLVGLLEGELEGLLLGLVIGCAQDLLSAGDLWVHVLTKGSAGFLTGLIGRQMAYVTPLVLFLSVTVISSLSGLLYLSTLTGLETEDIWYLVSSRVLVQAGMDAVIAVGLYALLLRGRWDDRVVVERVY